MDFMTAIDVGASALKAERTHLNVISMNLANAKTTRTPGGGAYQRKEVVFKETEMSPFGKTLQSELDGEVKGVRVESVKNDGREFRRVYEPNHPDADEEGYVNYPDINVVEEMANMMSAMRAYEANVSTITTSKAMFAKALDIGR